MSLLMTLDHLVRKHPAGTLLFQEGERGQKLYVIRSGTVKIWKQLSDGEIQLALLGPGEFFGEMALLEGLPRSASATVVEDALILEVEQGAFETLVRTRAEIAVRLLRRLSSRLREADRQIQSLLSRSGASRAMYLIRTLAEPPAPDGQRRLPAGMNEEQLWSRIGLAAEETRQVARTFERSGILTRGPDGRLVLGPEPLLDEFLLYVELQEQYDPMNARELADLAGVPLEEAHQILRRVISAKLREEKRGASQLSDGYTTYLALKQRFEYSD
jgi:CRP-like cAMP-binding protein